MAARATKSRPTTASPQRREPATPGRPGELAGLGLITVGALLLAGLHAPGAGPVLTFAVRAGALLGGRLVEALPYVLCYLGVRWLLRGRTAAPPATWVGVGLLALATSGLLHLRVPAGEEFAPTALGDALLHPPQLYGGYLGAALVWLLRSVVGPVATHIVLGMLALAGAVVWSERSVREWYDGGCARVRAGAARRRERRAARPARPRPTLVEPFRVDPTETGPPAPAGLDLPLPLYLQQRPAAAEPPAVDLAPTVATPGPTPAAESTAEPPALPAGAAPLAAPSPTGSPVAGAEPPTEVADDDRTPLLARPLVRPPVPFEATPHQLVLPGMPVPPELDEATREWYADGEPTTYKIPPLRLVEPPPGPPVPDRTPEILANCERLERALGHHKIEAKVVNTETGPTVTRYELELAPGIKVSKFASLENDMALALASTGIRLEAPVPGKGVVGIEVPNLTRETVHLHHVLLAKEFQNAPGPLPFVLGKDIAGHIKIAELTRMPHVLVAGTTNSGKSVCLNCIIISLLYRLSPRDLRFLMIDPKRVELTLYDGIPHLDRPVVTDPEDAADLLRGAVREMMARYERLQDLGVRNIASYNQHVDEDERMPYLVVIIDELAELMMLARAEVESSICRLAQLARATGIHLVVATQRPAVDVVTGLIKANIGTRIAFSVAQQVDSRVILDHVGAERLIGRGDMLYRPLDGSKPERLQGAYVDEEQVHKLVEYLQAMPSTLRLRYAESIIQPVSADDSGGAAATVEDSDLDDLFWECVDFVRMEGEGSTSRLQRTYGIGYNRAGRIMDQMHKMGIVGPGRGSKPREVLPGGPARPGTARSGPDLYDELTRGRE